MCRIFVLFLFFVGLLFIFSPSELSEDCLGFFLLFFWFSLFACLFVFFQGRSAVMAKSTVMVNL